MQTAQNLNELRAVLESARQNFRVERVPVTEASAWTIGDGALNHSSSGFFSVIGARFADDPHDSVFLYQPQSAVTGLLTKHIGGEPCFLLQARAEPGTYGAAQFGPTVQSTPANYLRLHGGVATPYIDYFIRHQHGARLLQESTQLDLGERYLMKDKRLLLVDVAEPVACHPNYVWASTAAIHAGLLEPAFFNIDLRALFAVMPWGDLQNDLPAPLSPTVRESMNTPLRAERLGSLIAALGHAHSPRYASRDIRKLDNWVWDAHSLRERTPCQGFSVEFFEVSATGREVKTWIQPLINSHGEGHVALCCRMQGGQFEVFVRVGKERGLSGGAALLPSYLRYPGQQGPVLEESIDRGFGSPCIVSLARTIESDEGGRFYNDVSTYELVQIDEATRTPSDGAWIHVGELKRLLTMSNLCSIQLRGVASLLFGIK